MYMIYLSKSNKKYFYYTINIYSSFSIDLSSSDSELDEAFFLPQRPIYFFTFESELFNCINFIYIVYSVGSVKFSYPTNKRT